MANEAYNVFLMEKIVWIVLPRLGLNWNADSMVILRLFPLTKYKNVFGSEFQTLPSTFFPTIFSDSLLNDSRCAYKSLQSILENQNKYNDVLPFTSWVQLTNYLLISTYCFDCTSSKAINP